MNHKETSPGSKDNNDAPTEEASGPRSAAEHEAHAKAHALTVALEARRAVRGGR